MTPNKRPISIVLVACLYLATGILGFAAHFRELLQLQPDSLLAEIMELLAIVAAIFLWRGHNWARALAFAWIAFHVFLSAFHSLPEMAMHSLICCAIAWLLFCSPADRFFRRSDTLSP